MARTSDKSASLTSTPHRKRSGVYHGQIDSADNTFWQDKNVQPSTLKKHQDVTEHQTNTLVLEVGPEADLTSHSLRHNNDDSFKSLVPQLIETHANSVDSPDHTMGGKNHAQRKYPRDSTPKNQLDAVAVPRAPEVTNIIVVPEIEGAGDDSPSVAIRKPKQSYIIANRVETLKFDKGAFLDMEQQYLL